MDKIDLKEIMGTNMYLSIMNPVKQEAVKQAIREGIHRALKIAADNAKLTVGPTPHPKGWPYLMVNQNPNRAEGEDYFVVDKQSILDIENLIV
jgi:hypothetical protein